MKLLPLRVLFVTFVFYTLLWIVPDKKIAFGLIACYVGLLWWLSKNLSQTLSIAYIALVPISLGKLFPIDLVKASDLAITGRPFGIAADVALTSRECIIAFMAFLIIREGYHRKYIPWPIDGLGWALLVLPLAVTVSTLFGSILPSISFLHTLFFVEPLIIYTYLLRFSHRLNRQLVFASLIAAIAFESMLALFQYMKGGTIGLVIEDFPGYVPIAVSTDVSATTFRLGGTFAHANILAHYLIFSLMVALPIVFDVFSPLRIPAAISLLLGLGALGLSQSRSGWLSLMVGVLVFFYFVEKKWRIQLHLPKRVIRIGLFSLPIFLSILGWIVLPRIWGTLVTFEPFGSGQTRLLLVREAFATIGSHPLFGVGLSMGVYYMFLATRFLPIGSSVFSYFPEPVQNGLLHMLVETGIVGVMPYIIALGLIARELWQRIKLGNTRDRLYHMGFFVGLVAILINAQLQPLLPDLPQIILLLVALRKD